MLQLASDLLEEPDCTICDGSDLYIAWFGIAAEASIFPETDPIARIHFVFGIDQILQSLDVDFPSGLVRCLGDAQQVAVFGILLCPLCPDLQAGFGLGLHLALLARTERFDDIIHGHCFLSDRSVDYNFLESLLGHRRPVHSFAGSSMRAF
jgi:hypothetical protein